MNRMSLSIFIVLLLTLGTFSTIGSHQTPGTASPTTTRQAGLSRPPILGFDCGLGAAQAALNGTSFPVAPSETGTFQTRSSCSWIGDIGNYTGSADGTTEPLVSDQDETFSLVSPSIGGGFTAAIVYLQNGTSSLNGFDLTVLYNPNILHAVEFDQTGLPWTSNSLFTPLSNIDNNAGIAHLVQVALGSTLGANFTLFRIRFDVVGVGVSSLTFSNDQIVNPGLVVHQAFSGAFDSESFFDPNHNLNWNGGFNISPNPPLPGSPTTFLSTMTCPGCTGALHYEWDFDNDGITDSVSKTATITIPTPTLFVSRVTLKVTDSATPLTHNATIVERLPFTTVIQGPTTLPVNTAAAWNGIWLGGIANYAVNWRFCPGTTTNTSVCSKPAASVSQPGQNNTQTLSGSTPGYHFAGVYNVSMKVTDSGAGPVPPSTMSKFAPVNVTGGTPAFTVQVSPQSAPVGSQTTVSAGVTYSSTYPTATGFRSTLFKYTLLWGDGALSTVSNAGLSTTATHVYLSAATYPIRVIVQDQQTASQIQETGFATVNIPQNSGFDYSLSVTPSHSSVPSGGGTASSLIIVNTVSGVPQQVSLIALPPVAEVSVTFNATTGTPPFASAMIVSVSAQTSPGTYTIPIIANTTSGLMRTVSYSLTVGTPTSAKPVIGVWSSHYSSSNITDTSLTIGSRFDVQVNVTNAPPFNGYEFVLYYDPVYINISSYDISTNTLFSNPFQAPGSDPKGPGAFRLGVVDLGQTFPSGSGLLVDITFKVVKVGVSPLVFAAGTADPSNFAAIPGGFCSSACPAGAPNWTRLVHGGTPIDVATSDGYFKNIAGSPGPVASFNYSPSSPQQGTVVFFDASGSFDPDNSNTNNRGIREYIWDFGDKSRQPSITTIVPTVSHDFALGGYPGTEFSGNFSVRLTVIETDNGFQGMKTVLLSIAPLVVHDIGIAPITLNSQVFQGQNVTLLITVSNFGTLTESYDLTLIHGLVSGLQNVTFVSVRSQTISPGTAVRYEFTLNTTSLAVGTYNIVATVSDSLDTNPSNNASVSQLQVMAPGEPPTANFTFTPMVPAVGQDVLFNGNSSMDPDGTVRIWSWSFGDGYYQQYFGYPFAEHIYNSPGNYTVTLTVTDDSGLIASKTLTIRVIPRPQHDVGLFFVQAYPSVAVSGQQISLEAGIGNIGSNSSTVELTFYYNGRVAVTQRGLLIASSVNYIYVQWDTTGVASGNYTISATVFLPGDPTPADNSLSDGQVMILPPPILTLVPSSGPVGTLVVVHGSGFITSGQFYPVELEMTFDNQLVGFFFIQSSSFNFSFDVPDAQVGVHTVHAVQLFPSNLDVQAVFTVTPLPAPISVSVSVGSIYFPGDTATIFVVTAIDGQASPVGTLQVVLIRPSGTNLTLTTVRTATGLYKATYTIPSTGPIGTYAVVVSAHLTGSVDGSALASFEVKPSWLSSNSKNIATGVAITGLVGVAALAWRKGYFRKNDEEESP